MFLPPKRTLGIIFLLHHGVFSSGGPGYLTAIDSAHEAHLLTYGHRDC